MRLTSRTIAFLLPLALPLVLFPACGSSEEDGGSGKSPGRGKGGSTGAGSGDGTGTGGSSTSKGGATSSKGGATSSKGGSSSSKGGADTGTGGSKSGGAGKGSSSAGNGKPETCGNGIDDNENGAADEGCHCAPNATQACYIGPAALAGKGICKKGTQTCKGQKSAEFDNTGWTACEGSVGPESKELCDSVDNDCDGSVDNGCECADGDEIPCKSPCGDGAQKCVNGKLGACSAPQPQPEVCDGKDNDCDGKKDDGLSKTCKNACGVGVQLCVGGVDLECEILAKTAEICDNGKDDNCDGQVDEPEACCAGVTCGGVCCETGDECCVGDFCPTDGKCPPPPCDGVKCGGLCCEGATACCTGNKCPPAGEACPVECTNIQCGTVCCGAGEVCGAGTKCEVPPLPCDSGLVCKGACCDQGVACTAAGLCPTSCEFGGTAMIVLDRSNSMRYSLDGVGTAATAAETRWAAAVTAVNGMIDKATEVDFGLILFPGQYAPNGDGLNDSPSHGFADADGNSGCVPLAQWMKDYPAGKPRGSDPPLPSDLYCSQQITVSVAPAVGSSAKVKPLITRDSTPLCFGTPIANGLLAAKAAKSSFVVLITDGDNNCGAADSFSDTVKSMSDAGTKVFVVGISDPNSKDITLTGQKALNKAACAGGVPADATQCTGKTYTGTKPAFYFSTSGAKLSTDLAAIATKLTCK